MKPEFQLRADESGRVAGEKTDVKDVIGSNKKTPQEINIQWVDMNSIEYPLFLDSM